jgi:methionyl-tRNA synthetase
MLMGYGGLALPYDVPSNEFMTIESRKISTSKNWAVWVPDYLSRYDPDPLRYILSINMPETSDTDFSWREFVRRNNDELVATYGNLVNRVLTLVYRNFAGCVPEPGELDDADESLLKNTESCLEQTGESLSRCNFRQAIMTAMSAAREANRYLDDKAPWKVIKENKQAAATSLYVALNAINTLKTMFYPFLPFSSQKVHEYLGFDGNVEDYGWQPQPLPPGQKLREPNPLFSKLDESIIDEETKRIGT